MPMLDLFPIDLRSDTVTKPTPAMRKVIADAEVGDDVFGEDPTVNRLQSRVAEILGKEAALFVPTGTMANQVCLASQTRPGDEVLLDADAHILNYEGGAPALLSGVQLTPLPGHHGRLSADLIRAAIRSGPENIPPTALVCVENTHNRAGGTVYDLAELERIFTTAHDHGLRVHLDGARIWNAAVASGCREAEIARWTDSVSACFSKGLGAPVGSIVAGTREFVQRARRFRRLFGGGMRQVGVIAAAALYALENHRARLADDHAKARELAAYLNGHPSLAFSSPVQTNILVVTITRANLSAAELVGRCQNDGVLFFPTGPKKFRLVTHLDVPAEAIKPAAEIILRHVEA